MKKEHISLSSLVKIYMDVFHVDKPGDIRMIYNRTSFGLNGSVWSSSFWLSTAKTSARQLIYNYCVINKDLGEMFLNFLLPREFREVSGVDLRQFKKSLGYVNCTERRKLFGSVPVSNFGFHWNRCWMGFRPSPFYATSFYYHAK